MVSLSKILFFRCAYLSSNFCVGLSNYGRHNTKDSTSVLVYSSRMLSYLFFYFLVPQFFWIHDFSIETTCLEDCFSFAIHLYDLDSSSYVPLLLLYNFWTTFVFSLFFFHLLHTLYFCYCRWTPRSLSIRSLITWCSLFLYYTNSIIIAEVIIKFVLNYITIFLSLLISKGMPFHIHSLLCC